MKRYIKPVSEVIQTEATCNSFVQATVMSGRDYSTVEGTIPVYENQDPAGHTYNAWNDDNLSQDTWGTSTWGGD
jgi:hypothetical protein